MQCGDTQDQLAQLQRLNQTLIDSEQRLRLALETGKIGLWVWDSSHLDNSGDWSPRLKEIFELPPESQVTHAMFLDRVAAEDREQVNQQVMQALAGANQGKYNIEYRTMPQRDGVQRWVTARGQAFFDSQGIPIRFIGTVMDITERKQAEQSQEQRNAELEIQVAKKTIDLAHALEQMEALKNQFQRAIDASPGLIWSALPDGQPEYLNQGWRDYTGLTLEQARNGGWARAIHPDDLPALSRDWESSLRSGMAGESEARVRRWDGTYRWFLVRRAPFFDCDGKLVKWYGQNTDIDDRKQAELRLSLSEASLRASERLARSQLEALTHTLTALTLESDPDRLLEHVLKMIASQVKVQSVRVWVKNEQDSRRLELLLTFENEQIYRPSKDSPAVDEVSLLQLGHPVWEEAFLTATGCVIGELDQIPLLFRLANRDGSPRQILNYSVPSPAIHESLVEAGVIATLTVPLIIAGRLTGMIGIRSREKSIFRPDSIELICALAQQVTLALQLMRLSQHTREIATLAERNRMERDVHDTLAQGFTSVILQLEAVKLALARNDLQEVSKRSQRASELAKLGLGEARRAVRALPPHVLQGRTLCLALEEMLQTMTDGSGLNTSLEIIGEPRLLPGAFEEGLFRIAQESLTNAIKHAQADSFSVRLTFEPENIELRLTDNGAGFEQQASCQGFGLKGMRKRVDQMGGYFAINSRAGRGTEIFVSFALA